MSRSPRVYLFCFLLIGTVQSVSVGVVRDWDGEGATLNWSEAANWSDDGVPNTTDDVFIGSLPAAFDTTVVLDLNADLVLSLALENGADLDLDGARLVANVDMTVGAGAASGTSISELIVHKRSGTSSGAIAIDANQVTIGANGKLVLRDGPQIEIDGTGGLPGTLSVADGGEVQGYGQIALTDTDASLGGLSSLIENEGDIVIEDPLFIGIGEPTTVQLEIIAPEAPMFAQLDFAGAADSGLVAITRNASLLLDQPFFGPNRLTLAANATLSMAQAGTISDQQTVEVNSGVLNPGGVNELPAVPAVIAGDGLLSMSGIIRVNQVDEELIIETPFDGIAGLISSRGIVRFRGGGNIRAIEIDDLGLGVIVNESNEALEFEGGRTYDTRMTNAGTMAIAESGGEATVELKAFEQTDAGTLALDIGGAAAGEFEALSVIDDIALDGTLDISLTQSFEPALGVSFTILSSQTGLVNSEFATANLPVFDGRTFELVYNAASVELQVVAVPLAGDFDADGDVDGADFLLWQRGGSPDPLSADDLATWQSAYGGVAASAAAVVPEPTAVSSLWLAAMLTLSSNSRRSR
ncbi:MAG: hypothetical protein AAGD11_13800 [Planctomycetota bacterium]